MSRQTIETREKEANRHRNWNDLVWAGGWVAVWLFDGDVHIEPERLYLDFFGFTCLGVVYHHQTMLLFCNKQPVWMQTQLYEIIGHNKSIELQFIVLLWFSKLRQFFWGFFFFLIELLEYFRLAMDDGPWLNYHTDVRFRRFSNKLFYVPKWFSQLIEFLHLHKVNFFELTVAFNQQQEQQKGLPASTTWIPLVPQTQSSVCMTPLRSSSTRWNIFYYYRSVCADLSGRT